MGKVYFTTTKEGQPNTDYSVRLIGTAEKSKNLKEAVHLSDVRTKKQLSEVAGERSFLYGMYLSYLKKDKNFDCKIDIDVLPTPQEATATTIEIEFDGTSTTDITLDFSILNDNYKISKTFSNGVTPAQIAEELQKELKKIETELPFDVSEYSPSDTKVTLTSTVYGSCASHTPVIAKITGEGITSVINITAGENDASADEMITYINKKKLKSRLFIFEDGIDTTNFITALEEWQDFDDIDKRGRMIQTKVDTMENLVEIGQGLNISSQTVFGFKKVEKDGYKCGHIFEQPCYFSSTIAGVLNMLYTEGTDLSDIAPEMVFGDPSNVSKPIAGIVLPEYGIIEDEEWIQNSDGDEISLLQDYGISVFSTNELFQVVIGDVVTTYRKDREGNTDENFHWMEFDECVSSFLSYTFDRMKKFCKHRRLEEGITKPQFIVECQSAYNVCSGIENDPDLKRSFKFVEPAGLTAFLNALKSNTLEDYANGKITSQAIKVAVYSQLREIMINFRFGYNS